MMKSEDRTSQQRGGLPDEHPLGDAGQIVLVVAFLVVWVLDTFIFRFSTVLNGAIPLAIRLILGGINVAAALYLAWASHQLIFQQKQQPPRVVRTGVYGIARHPMYLSVALFLLGILLTSLSIAAGLVWAVLIGFLNIIAHYEERQLLETFKDAYADYMNEVARWGFHVWPVRKR